MNESAEILLNPFLKISMLNAPVIFLLDPEIPFANVITRN